MKQHVVAFARDERGHAQQLQGTIARADRQRRPVRPGLDDINSVWIDPVASQRGSGSATRDHDPPDSGKRPTLARFERGGINRIDSGFGRQWMVHESHQPQAREFPFGLLRQGAQCETIEEHRDAIRDRREHARGVGARMGCGERKAVV